MSPRKARSSENTCSKCGEWKNEDYPLCYSCSMDEKGFVMCDCGDKYYDPEKYQKCYDCNQKERGPSINADYPFDLPAEPTKTLPFTDHG